jgi:2-methylcitrate dehydratase PrpD
VTHGITSRLAAFVVRTDFDALPPEVVERSKEQMLNAAGIGLAGLAELEGQVITQFVQDRAGTPTCTVLGAPFRSTPEYAALANGTLVHALDFDENVERRANHPSNEMFPTVMAVGEQVGASGPDVIAAFALGCEVSTKIGAAGDLDEQFPSITRHGWNPQPVAGVFGATAAAAKLLGLTQEQLENAFGLAASQASGLLVNTNGTSSKPLQAGIAAMKGILCATLAGRGMTGARDGIEAERGYLDAIRRDRDIDADEFIGRLGNPYDVIDPGVRLKVYPCGSYTHVSLEAMLRLIEEHGVQADDVAAIEVAVPPRWGMTGAAIQHPETGTRAKFSMAYVMAVALVYGPPRIEHFTNEAIRDPKLVRLLDRVTVVTTEKPTERATRPSTVTVTLTDGRILSHRAEFAKGHRHNPVTQADMDAKFEACVRGRLPADLVRPTITAFRTLDALADVRPLFASLGGQGQAAVAHHPFA